MCPHGRRLRPPGRRRRASVRGGSEGVGRRPRRDHRLEVGTPPLGTATTRIDAGGGLVSPPFADPHLHLDKVYTLDRAGETALERGVGHGVLYHRAFADVDTGAGLTGVEPLLDLRAEFADVVDL